MLYNNPSQEVGIVWFRIDMCEYPINPLSVSPLHNCQSVFPAFDITQVITNYNITTVCLDAFPRSLFQSFLR